MEKKYSRKLASQKMVMWSILAVLGAYFILCGYQGNVPDGNVVLVALIALGVDATALKGANALGDHGALKKEESQ